MGGVEHGSRWVKHPGRFILGCSSHRCFDSFGFHFHKWLAMRWLMIIMLAILVIVAMMLAVEYLWPYQCAYDMMGTPVVGWC